ncbi:MAG: hypothetical protein ACOC0D_02685 [Spirochaeta sp.]
MRIRFSFFMLVGIISAAPAFAEPFAVITYAGGSEFSVYRKAVLAEFSPQHLPHTGIPVFAGDILQTAGDGVLELQLYPSGDQLLVYPNTNVEMQEVGENPQIRLTYGRIFSRSNPDNPASSISVAVGPAAFEAAESSLFLSYLFGQDVPADISLVVQAAVLDGDVSYSGVMPETVESGSEEPASSETGKRISAGEMLEIGIVNPSTDDARILANTNVSTEVLQYVAQHPFEGETAPQDQAVAVFSYLDYKDRLREDPRILPVKSLPAAEVPDTVTTAVVRDYGRVERPVSAVPPQQRFFVPNRGLQGTGIGVFSLGAVTEILGLGILLFGDSLLPDVIPEQATRHRISYGMIISGGAAMGVGTGLFFLGFSF